MVIGPFSSSFCTERRASHLQYQSELHAGNRYFFGRISFFRQMTVQDTSTAPQPLIILATNISTSFGTLNRTISPHPWQSSSTNIRPVVHLISWE